jgi:hypothetical protein
MIFTVAALAGCTPWATYPHVKGMTELGSPATEPVPTLMARAIMYVKDTRCDGAEHAINLPPGVPAKVYTEVAEKAGFGAPMQSDSDLAYSVTEVRLRGLNAEVDIVYPAADTGEYQLMTLKYRNSVMPGWNVVDTRVWNIYVESPTPNFIPANQAIVTGSGPSGSSQ